MMLEKLQCKNCNDGWLIWDIDKTIYHCAHCGSDYTNTEINFVAELQPEHEQQPHERPIAYIAGALNALSIEYLQNVRRMILWSNKIRALDYAVFVPGIDLLHGIASNDWDYNAAFDNSQPFLAKSDIVFVCPGWESSKGTAREIELAESLDVPVYYGDEGYELLRIKKAAKENVSTPFKECSDPAKELNDEALAELKKRIAESPFRNMRDSELKLIPLTSDGELIVPDSNKRSTNIQQDQFIEESNNHNIIGYLKRSPHPDYRIVSVIPHLKRMLKEWFHRNWAAATLIAVFVTWCVAVHSRMSL
ncbi:hypothetical protein LCGC14_0377840 [marine sediment metagenome]|uniref:DUF4406 domain-containing protein n=1 Tax=marine sediment metagenome TaxID=412755 RepID=A0A0F9VQC8_9ZZZZ